MSPELHKGTKLEYSSDIYSFGVLAFELLTGERPINVKQPQNNETTHALKYSVMHTLGKIPSVRSKNKQKI